MDIFFKGGNFVKIVLTPSEKGSDLLGKNTTSEKESTI